MKFTTGIGTIYLGGRRVGFGTLTLSLPADMYAKMLEHPAVLERVRRNALGLIGPDGACFDPERVKIEEQDRVVTITATTADFYTRQQDAAMKEQAARSKKRPAWKTPYGPQKR